MTNHLGAAQLTSVFLEIFAIKAAKLLEISADLITSVSADVARMESVPNSISVSKHAISIKIALLAAAPLGIAVPQICAMEGKQMETFAIMEKNV